MSAITDEDLDAIEARANATPPLPWFVEGSDVMHDFEPDAPRGYPKSSRLAECCNREVAELLAHAREDELRLVAEVRRLDNEVENLCIAATIGPRVAAVNAAVERATTIARFRDVLAAIDARPEMYAQTPEHAASVLSGVHLAGGGNGASWVAAMTALGFTKGNTYLPVTTWDDVRRLARHLHETAETWAVTP